MGIKGLTNLILDVCPDAIKEDQLKNYFSRTIAIDASMTIYQFLISIRGAFGGDLQNEQGEVTNHLQGLLYRTAKMLDYGIKPVYVFDGKAPELKGDELSKRKEKRDQAKIELEEAKENGDDELVNQLSKRTVRVGKKENDDCKKLLGLMGVPYVESPSEAEAQCAELCKGGLVYGTATEDMDSLTFATPILLRNVTASEAKKLPVREFTLTKVLEGLKFTMEQFIDFCILCGCDYCTTIKGIGPKKALTFIQKYKNIEGVIQAIKNGHLFEKHEVTKEFEEQYEEARKLFKNPIVTPSKDITLKWNDPDEQGILDFLVKEKGFDEKKVQNVIEKIKKSRKQTTQVRLDSFFKVKEGSGKKKEPVKKGDKKGGAQDKKKPDKRKRDEDEKKEKKKKI